MKSLSTFGDNYPQKKHEWLQDRTDVPGALGHARFGDPPREEQQERLAIALAVHHLLAIARYKLSLRLAAPPTRFLCGAPSLVPEALTTDC